MGVQKQQPQVLTVPFTAFQSPGIVASYSYKETVKPTLVLVDAHVVVKTRPTVGLLLILHDKERVIIDITEELDIGSSMR